MVIQQIGQPLAEVLRNAPQCPKKRSYTHVVRPYWEGDAKTFKSMYAALDASSQSVDFVAPCFAEDLCHAKRYFQSTPILDRSILDIHQFQNPKKLPLLFDVIGQKIHTEYTIFTNTDICLMPYFYDAVANILDLGFDAIIINRRTIPQTNLNPALCAAEIGKPHEGYDCFVFPTKTPFFKTNACIGMGSVMRSLRFNLAALSKNLLLLKDAHLTYHYGDSKAWKAHPEYQNFNRAEGQRVLDHFGINDPFR